MATLVDNRLAYSTDVNVQDHPLVFNNLTIKPNISFVYNLFFPLQLAFPAVTVCNRNRINCRELNEYKILVGCVDYDTWTCNKTASDECGELCSLVTIACEEDKNESIAPCDGGEGSGSGR